MTFNLRILILIFPFTIIKLNAVCQISKEVIKINSTVSYLLIADSNKIILHNNNDTFYLNLSFTDYKLTDINNDGNKEIIFKFSIVNGYYYKLLMYKRETKTIEEIKGIEKIGSFKTLSNTYKYYISIKENGCSDLNWQSYLFKIENNKVKVIAYLDWRECSEKPKVKLYKLNSKNKPILLKTYSETMLPSIDLKEDSDTIFYDNIPTDTFWQKFIRKNKL